MGMGLRALEHRRRTLSQHPTSANSFSAPSPEVRPWRVLSLHTGIFKAFAFLKNLFIYMYMNPPHTCAGALEGQERVSVPLELEVHVAI